jgi:hypothetical protein
VKNGQAGVALDPEIDEVVKGDDYWVVARRADPVGKRLERWTCLMPRRTET